MELPTHYDYTERYRIIGRVTITELLSPANRHEWHYFLEFEKGQPLAIEISRPYLEDLNPRKVVWALDVDTSLGHFRQFKETEK